MIHKTVTVKGRRFVLVPEDEYNGLAENDLPRFPEPNAQGHYPGEKTMAVSMVIGNTLEIHSSPLVGAQTMSGLLANEFGNATGLHRSGLLEVALILLLMSLIFNIIARSLIVGNKGAKV